MDIQPKRKIFISSADASTGNVSDFVTYLGTPINCISENFKYSYVIVDQLTIQSKERGRKMENGDIVAVILCCNIVDHVQFGQGRAERLLGVVPPPTPVKSYPGYHSGIRAELDKGTHPFIRITLKTLKANGSLVQEHEDNMDFENISMILSFY